MSGDLRGRCKVHRRAVPWCLGRGYIPVEPLIRLSMPTTPTTDQVTCPSCAAPATGRFCATCGAPLAGALCASCRAPLTPGAKFCHRCGTVAGASVPATQPLQPAEHGGFNAALPWAVAGIALLALVALVAGQHFGRQPAAVGANSEAAAAAPDDGNGVQPVRGPDISSLSPRERADRLY